jgi:hypothetical protein
MTLLEELQGIALEADKGRDLARGHYLGRSEENHFRFHCQNALYLIAEALAISSLPVEETKISVDAELRAEHLKALKTLLAQIASDTTDSIRKWETPLNTLIDKILAAQDHPGSTIPD